MDVTLAKLKPHINVDEVVDFHSTLVRTPSYEQNEAVIAEVVRSKLAAAGVECTVQPVEEHRHNVVASIGRGEQGAPRVLLNSHLDTIPPGDPATWTGSAFSGDVRDGRVYGRGSSDCKGGVTGMTMALIALARAGVQPAGSITFTGVCGEVDGHLGTRHLVSQGLAADYAVVGEYSEGNKIAVAYRGGLWLRIDVSGKSAHPGRPNMGSDAIKDTLEAIIPALRGYRFTFTPHELLPDPALTLNMIRGGERVNWIADKCSIWVDIRTVPGQDYEEISSELDDTLEQARQTHPHLDYRVARLRALHPFESAIGAPWVQTFASSVSEVFGVEPGYLGKVGCCDGNILHNELDIPTIVYGPGNPSGMSPDEYVDIDVLGRVVAVYALAGGKLASR